MDLPTGTVTFLFTDIEGSTKLWDNHPEQMQRALARHDSLLRDSIDSNSGCVFKTVGDAFCAAFETAPDAVAAAVQAQRYIESEPWEAPISIRVRMGIHTGSVEHRDRDYFGPALNRVARLMSIGSGGQILISGVAHELVRDHLNSGVGLRDLGSHRLKDLGRPESVYQATHPDLPAQFAPVRSLGNPELPNNLPQQVTSFIGREKQTADVKRLLATTRLLTLIAPGGTGKTRLSLQVAADVLDEFPDGAWFVELAPLADPTMVAQSIAQVLNVTETTGEPILQTLVRELRSKLLLIVFDNCEHLVESCATVANALLRGCTELKILASSRQGMNIGGEIVYALPALSLPDPKRPQTVESLSQFEAVRLFVDRAVAVRMDFAVTNQNAAALAQLCFRLDGIPLALELAAARVRMLSVEDINSRLDNRFRLLTGGSRTALPRQQTLRALIDWSYDILNEQEQTLFARLSVFAGGWSLAAAEIVCAGGEVEDWEIFDLMTALSDKSLVVYDAEGADSRFRLLETLREYAHEKLESTPDAAELGERHARYFAAAVAEKSQLKGEAGEQGLQWMSTEADNLRAALDCLWKASDVETAATIAVSLSEFWNRRGWLREACLHLDLAVGRVDSIKSMELRSRTLKVAGWFAFLLRDLSRAEWLTKASVDTAVSVGATEIHASALNNLALIVKAENNIDKAESLFLEAIELYRKLGKATILSASLMNLGLLLSGRGKGDAAQTLFEEARTIYERQADGQGMANWFCNQSDLALRQSNWEYAQTLAEQSVERYRKLDNRLGIAYALANLTEAASRLDRHEVADVSAREAIAICSETHHHDIVPVILCALARSRTARVRAKSAAVLFTAAARIRTLLQSSTTPEEECELAALEGVIRSHDNGDFLMAAEVKFSAMDGGAVLAELLTQD